MRGKDNLPFHEDAWKQEGHGIACSKWNATLALVGCGGLNSCKKEHLAEGHPPQQENTCVFCLRATIKQLCKVPSQDLCEAAISPRPSAISVRSPGRQAAVINLAKDAVTGSKASSSIEDTSINLISKGAGYWEAPPLGSRDSLPSDAPDPPNVVVAFVFSSPTRNH